MTEHNKILIKIILYTYLIITFISLSYFAEGWKYQMHSMIAIMLIMTILSGKHLMRWVQQFTGLSFFLTWYGLFILYMISGLLSIVILPIRIITLSISYFTEKRTEFHNYMITLQDSFRNIIINICLHQGYLITHEIDFLYKTPEIKNETIINSKQLALEIKENIDIVKNIGEIDYSKKEYFATSINKLNTFINKTDNSIHFDYYKTISYQNKVDSFFKIAVLSCIISLVLGLLIYLGLNETPIKEFSKYKSSIELFNKTLWLFNEHQVFAYSFTFAIISFIMFSILSIKTKKKVSFLKSNFFKKL